MDVLWRGPIERFGVETAPPELHLTHSLLNSFGPGSHRDMGLLDDPATARARVCAARAPVARIPGGRGGGVVRRGPFRAGSAGHGRGLGALGGRRGTVRGAGT